MAWAIMISALICAICSASAVVGRVSPSCSISWRLSITSSYRGMSKEGSYRLRIPSRLSEPVFRAFAYLDVLGFYTLGWNV